MSLLRASGSWLASRKAQPTSPALRVLNPGDERAVTDLLDADPLGGVFVASRIQAGGLVSWRMGAEVWGWETGGRLEGVCYAGANLVPVAQQAGALDAFAERAVRQGRRCSSIMGRVEAVLGFWQRLEQEWGPAREVRPNQPLLVTSAPAAVRADPRVRPARPEELDVVFPAAVAMFTEEVGVTPVGADGGALYRARLAELISTGRLLVIAAGGEVIFKADIAAVSPHACQVQGVWVHPDHRGQGLGTAATAAVVNHALAHIAPVVTLYVNDYNIAARRSYRRVGMRPAGTFASVLF